jgi:hypothetical protein
MEETLFKPHSSSQCTLLNTICSMRGNGRYVAIAVQDNAYFTALTKQAVTAESLAKMLEKEKKEMRGLLGAMDKRITALEPKGKKRGNAASNSTNANKKAKGKETKSGQSSGTVSGQKGTESGGKTGTRRGKGKGQGKKAA